MKQNIFLHLILSFNVATKKSHFLTSFYILNTSCKSFNWLQSLQIHNHQINLLFHYSIALMSCIFHLIKQSFSGNSNCHDSSIPQSIFPLELTWSCITSLNFHNFTNFWILPNFWSGLQPHLISHYFLWRDFSVVLDCKSL